MTEERRRLREGPPRVKARESARGGRAEFAETADPSSGGAFGWFFQLQTLNPGPIIADDLPESHVAAPAGPPGQGAWGWVVERRMLIRLPAALWSR